MILIVITRRISYYRVQLNTHLTYLGTKLFSIVTLINKKNLYKSKNSKLQNFKNSIVLITCE